MHWLIKSVSEEAVKRVAREVIEGRAAKRVVQAVDALNELDRKSTEWARQNAPWLANTTDALNEFDRKSTEWTRRNAPWLAKTVDALNEFDRKSTEWLRKH